MNSGSTKWAYTEKKSRLLLYTCESVNIGVSKICKPSVIIASSSLKLSLDDVFESSVFKEVNILEVIITLNSN